MERFVIGGLFALLALIALFSSIFIVREKTIAIVERLGKFRRIARPGPHLKAPFGIDRVVNHLSLRIHQLDVLVETKTEDNVFVKVPVSVPYYVLEDDEKVKIAHYKLEDPVRLMNSHVFDVVRSTVPKHKLDAVFSQKDEIAQAIKAALVGVMSDYGYGIQDALVNDIEPAANVKDAMNEINAAQRQRVAASEKGEADKILRIKAAEAEAETKRLQGEGIANQRKAIADGLTKSIEDLAAAAKTDGAEVMRTLLTVQFFDTLKEIGAQSGSRVIFVPYTPGGMTAIQDQLMTALQAQPDGEHNKAPVAA